VPDLVASIRDLIARYLNGDVSADDLPELLPDGWDLDEVGDPAATELVMSVVGYLAEYQAGDRDEPNLHESLARLLRTVRVKYAVTPLSTYTAGSTATQVAAWSLELAGAGRSDVRVSAS
jgi:hypothetical protein